METDKNPIHLTITVKKPIFLITKITISSLIGITAAFIILEIATRLFFPVSDAPDIQFSPILGNIFVPNQAGFYVKGQKNEIHARFRINSSGWNSPHEYSQEKASDTYRIAVIGDSFIEALQVDYDKSYPYLIEQKIDIGKPVEVYTFGHSGANLFHYSYMLSHILETYKPDLAIVNIVFNDFSESLYGISRRDNWSLRSANGTLIEEPPHEAGNLFIKKIIRKSALVRYLTINLDLINKSQLLNKLFYGNIRALNVTQEWSNDTSDTLIASSVEYTLNKYQVSAKTGNAKLLLILDADRNAIYTGNKNKEKDFYKALLTEKASRLGIPLVDLSDAFSTAWSKNGERFDWETDDHWNKYGHEVVGNTVVEWLVKHIN